MVQSQPTPSSQSAEPTKPASHTHPNPEDAPVAVKQIDGSDGKAKSERPPQENRPTPPRLVISTHAPIQQKRKSVADLRKSFEDTPRSLKEGILGISPIKLVPPKLVKSVTAPGVSAIAISNSSLQREGLKGVVTPTTEVQNHRTSLPQSFPRHAPRTTKSHDIDSLGTPTRPSLLRQSFGSNRRLKTNRAQASSPQAPKQESRTFRPSTSRRTGESPSRSGGSSSPPSNPSHPLLLSRTLSVRISTIEPPQPDAEDPERTGDNKKSGIARSSGSLAGRRVSDLRRVFDLPQSATPFLPFLKTRRYTTPSKAGPSLPIMVSTTVAVTTRRPPSIAASVASSRILRRKTAPASKPGSRKPSTRTLRNKLKKKRRESAIKDRINLFEHLSHSGGSNATSSPAASKAKSSSNTASSKGNSRSGTGSDEAPSNQSSRGSRFMRVLSFGGIGKKNSKAGSSNTESGRPSAKQSTVSSIKRTSLAQSNVSRQQGHYPDATSSTHTVRSTIWKVLHYDLDTQNESIGHAINTQEHSASSSSGPISSVIKSSSSSMLMAEKELKRNLLTPTTHRQRTDTTRSGRILPTRKSYGALDLNHTWYNDATCLHEIDPANSSGGSSSCAATKEPRPRQKMSVSDRGGINLPVFRRTGKTISPMSLVTTTTKRSRVPSSFGRKSGSSLRKGAAARPILTPEEGMADRSRSTS